MESISHRRTRIMAKDWYKWTVGEIEDNLNLLQAQAVDYLKEPFECDCFLKHTSVIRGYANEMQSFAKTQEEKALLSRLAAWSDKWHKVFEGKKTVPKEVMQSLHDETREMRKGVEDRFFIKQVAGHSAACSGPGCQGVISHDQELLGETGSMAELHDLLVSRGFYYDSSEGKADVAGEHQAGYVLVYKNRQGDVARLTLTEKGLAARRVHEEISPHMVKTREHATADTYTITNVVTMENPENPGRHSLSCKHGKCECVIRGHPKEHFAKESFRRVKDQPKPGYDMIVGCPKGEFRAGRCQVGTELHKIIAPMSKCK
jgi:hypothetical protein